MITIKNLRREKPTNPWDVKVDRSSILGNPFVMKGESQRDSVCELYEKEFMRKLSNTYTNDKSDNGFSRELDRLCGLYKEYGKLNLFCWCAPKRCHAETIKKHIEDNVIL